MNNTTRIALLIGLLTIIILSLYSVLPVSNGANFIEETEVQRAEKDIWLGSDMNSPFLIKNAPFHRLSYYAPDKAFVIEAEFLKRMIPDSVTLTTSTGESQSYSIYGEAKFIINNTNCVLLLLYLPGEAELFMPFMDATSGKTTYGAGRYLEVPMPINNKITLNFNLAYNPYCAYVDDYTCPFPPKSNVLTVAIEAGEKTFH